MSTDAEQQVDELAVVEAICGEDCKADVQNRILQVWIPDIHAAPPCVLEVHLPHDYPSTSAPTPVLRAGHLSDDVVADACAQLLQLWSPGEVVLYSWVEWLRDRPHLWRLQPGQGGQPGPGTDPPGAAGPASDGRRDLGGDAEDGDGDDDDEWLPEDEDARSSGCEGEAGEHVAPTSSRLAAAAAAAAARRADRAALRAAAALQGTDVVRERVRQRIFSGEPHTERRSTFQGHAATVHSPEEVEAVLRVLLENNKIRAATHNIMAYRIQAGTPGCFHADCDDDGEHAAGRGLQHLLQVAQAVNVVVVVTRWYGGVHLGSSRFGIINNCAREVLEEYGFIPKPSRGKPGKDK